MIELNFTETDLLQGRILEKGWYKFKLTNVDTKAKKNNPSENNIVIDLECMGPNDSIGNTVGVEIKVYFSSNAWIKPLLEAVGVDVVALVRDKQPINLERLKDQEVDAFVEPGEYEGRPNNQVKSYAAPGKFSSQR